MSCYKIEYKDGKKWMIPVKNKEEYLALRQAPWVQEVTAAARRGETFTNKRGEQISVKTKLPQFAYSCLPNDDGSLAKSTRLSNAVAMDIDYPGEDCNQSLEAWKEATRELVMSKQTDVGMLMFGDSATKGFHMVFSRQPELSQEENLMWASQVLGVAYDAGAKDHTRVMFEPSGEIYFLDEELFDETETEPEPSPDPSRKGRGVDTQVVDNGVTVGSKGAMSPKAPQSPMGPMGEGPTVVTTPLPCGGAGGGSAALCFDLCAREAGLSPTTLDTEGHRHSNLMAVLSVGLPKLMSRAELEAVVRQKMPSYAQTEDCKALINYFYENYSAEKGYMSPKLRAINAQCQQSTVSSQKSKVSSPSSPVPLDLVEGSQNDDEEIMDSLLDNWDPPQLPKKLPRLIWLLIAPFPPQYHPMLVITALLVLGAIGSHFRAIYLDGRVIAGNLFAALIAGSGKGKNWVTMLFNIMVEKTLQVWDNAEWEKLRQNAEMREKKKNAKDCPAKYHPKLRIMETMSKTSLLEVQTNLGENGMLLCNYAEADELANSTKASFSNLSVLLRKAWDLSTHKQFYMSEASCNTQCKLNAAVLVTGTVKSVLSRLFADVENGLAQRFIPMIMPRLKRTFRPPVFTPLSKEEVTERDALLTQLWQQDLSLGDQTLMLELPKTKRLVEQWYDELEERYADGDLTEAEADLSHRVGQFMMRAMIPFVALYGEESREALDLVRWLGDFSYYNICHIFAARVSLNLKEAEEMLYQQPDARKTAEPLLNSMGEIFTVREFQERRIALGQSPEVKVLLCRYCKSGKIEKMGKGVYRRTLPNPPVKGGSGMCVK